MDIGSNVYFDKNTIPLPLLNKLTNMITYYFKNVLLAHFNSNQVKFHITVQNLNEVLDKKELKTYEDIYGLAIIFTYNINVITIESVDIKQLDEDITQELVNINFKLFNNKLYDRLGIKNDPYTIELLDYKQTSDAYLEKILDRRSDFGYTYNSAIHGTFNNILKIEYHGQYAIEQDEYYRLMLNFYVKTQNIEKLRKWAEDLDITLNKNQQNNLAYVAKMLKLYYNFD